LNRGLAVLEIRLKIGAVNLSIRPDYAMSRGKNDSAPDESAGADENLAD
jgi:hypothetical protein